MASKNIVNLNNMKHANRFLVLGMLLENGPMSRVDITRALKCDGTTITHIVRDLAGQGLVESAGMGEPNGGRPKELIALNSSSRQVIGISLEPPYVTGIISGLSGKIEFCEKLYLSAGISSEKLVELVKKLAAGLLSRVERDKLLGIGLSTFGILSPKKHEVVYSNYFPAIKDVPFIELFHEEFNVMPEIVDNTHAKALAEIGFSTAGGKREGQNFILFDIGIGISLLNVCNGVPVIGANGYFGEFGHIILDPDGKNCYCGRKGCLETLTAIPALENEVSSALGNKDISFDKIVSLYREGDKRVEKIINNSAGILGTAAGNMLTVLPTDKAVFTGRLMELGDGYFSALEKSIRKTAFPLFVDKAEISKSRRSEENAALGACSIILKAFFNGNIEQKNHLI